MITGVILAGGKSSRMGGSEKAFAPLHGRSLLSRIIARLSPQVDRLAINANGDPLRFGAFGLDVFPDELAVQKGPIGGLHASLAWAQSIGASTLVSVTADVPFLPADLARRLMDAGAPAIAASKGGEHFTIGAWPVHLCGRLETAISAEGVFRMKDWVRVCGAKRVLWESGAHDPFFNINTPADLAEAERICQVLAP